MVAVYCGVVWASELVNHAMVVVQSGLMMELTSTMIPAGGNFQTVEGPWVWWELQSQEWELQKS